jgi:cytochrome c oxidase cbb3-type subunit 3
MEEKNQNNQSVDAAQNEEHDLEHSYDGIQELDNPPPRWIMAIFYLTIGFSIIYAAYYFWLDVGDLQDAQYSKKSQIHDAKYQMTGGDAEELTALTGDADIEAGKAIYSEMSCFACHGMNGEGNAIGPNLTDDAWIHGCDFQSVFDIIKNGVVAKGMAAYRTQLSESRMQLVASYVLSLRGSNPPNAKEAQGEICD